MTVAFITPEYPHINLKPSAGIGSSIKNLAFGLVNTGHKVVVFVVFQKEENIFYDEEVQIISISRKGYRIFGWYLERKHIQKIIQEKIQEHKIDIIEAPDWTGITAFMTFSIPLVIRLHGSDAYFCNLESRKQKRKHYFFEKTALKQADKIVSVSIFTGNLTKQLFHLKCDIETIYNGINTEIFKPIDVKIQTGQLLYFGAIIRKKGVLELAKIFNHVVENHKNGSLLLIGKDKKDVFENKSTLSLFNEILTEKAKSRVTYLPEVPYKDIKMHIAKAHVVVLPSFAEAFPMTWLETLAMEKALVASNIGWANELMKQETTGYIVNPLNHEEFSNKIVTLLVNDILNETFGKNGRMHVIENFSISIIIKQNIKLYKSLLPKNG